MKDKLLSEFVILNDYIPDAIYDLRYYSTNNFMGRRVPGYVENCAILSKKAAKELKKVNDELKKNHLCLKIFDTYRPQMAVDAFLAWSCDYHDLKMKKFFYPNIHKSDLIPMGFISTPSSHSRGSTVDLTICDQNTKQELDMGGSFDYFGKISYTSYSQLTPLQKKNRFFLQDIMSRYGFAPIEEEWWHFTLIEEPFPNTYFNFPVKRFHKK